MRTTTDSIAMRGTGAVMVEQPAGGHRFTLDSVLLADFCRVRPRDRVLEPGGGTGVITLLLAKKHPRARFTPVEVQEDLHALCEANVVANGLTNVLPLHRDIRRLARSLSPAGFDLIVANPPYQRTGAGRTSPDPGRRTARQDALALIGTWVGLGRFLKQGGRYAVVFPAARLAELCALLRDRTLEPKRLRCVHPKRERPASLVLLEAVRDGGAGLEVLPPLVVHEADGSYTAEMRDIYGTG